MHIVKFNVLDLIDEFFIFKIMLPINIGLVKINKNEEYCIMLLIYNIGFVTGESTLL
tara:strand:+ start:624 stop:794 length:171 start_codon:yes stop_codon:yes gene_type:complete